MGGQAHPFRIRTITVFLNFSVDASSWQADVEASGIFLKGAQRYLESLGYEVQTVRIATQPFEQYLGSTQDEIVANAQTLERLATSNGIPLISIGSSSRPQDLQSIPAVVAATSGTSCTYQLGQQPTWQEACQSAEAVLNVARLTGGAGNFRFAVSANCPPGIPFFPVAAAAPHLHRSFALGTECDTLLHTAFQAAAKEVADLQIPPQQQHGSGSSYQQQQHGSSSRSKLCILEAAARHLHEVLLQSFEPLEAAALALAGEAPPAGPTTTAHPAPDAAAAASASTLGFSYLGLDTSLAPGLDTPALTNSYALLGLGQLGGPGSLTISGGITRVLKDLPLRKTGYCGLMLAVCEDQGLAEAAAAGTLRISQLLQYSAVCGCGLDTVPVPGPANSSSSSSGAGCEGNGDVRLSTAIAGVIMDTATLANRLQKPLACRLLPVPGKREGDATAFTSPYLINSQVMSLET